MHKTGAEILWECLMREGVRHVFGYPGGAILPAYDALARYPIHHVLVGHEQAATHAADGYARASGKAGVSRMTIGVAIEDGKDRQLEANLYRLQDVLLVKNLTRARPVAEEIALIRLRLTELSGNYFATIPKHSRARFADITLHSIMLEISQAPEVFDAFVEELHPSGTLEIVRSGQIALATHATVTPAETGIT